MPEKRRRAPLLEKLEPGLAGSNGYKSRGSHDKIYNDVNNAVGQAWYAFLNMFDIKVPNMPKKKKQSGGRKKSIF